MVHPARSSCFIFRSDVWNVYIEENSNRKSLSSIDNQQHKRLRLHKNSSSCRHASASIERYGCGVQILVFRNVSNQPAEFFGLAHAIGEKDHAVDRKRDVMGKRVSVGVELGGVRIIKKKKK